MMLTMVTMVMTVKNVPVQVMIISDALMMPMSG